MDLTMDSLTLADDSPAGFTLPALLPPPGVTSNFVNPKSRAKDLIVTSALCLAFMIISVIVRFYTKLRIKHSWGWDDWLCIPATVGTIGFTAVALSILGKAVGPHQWNVPFTAFTPSLLRRFVVLDMLYSPTVLMAKISLLLLYLRIFRPNEKLRYCIYFSIVFLSLFYSGTFIAYAVLSIPKRGQSQMAAIMSVDTAKDIPLGITQGAVNVGSDFYIFCLPIPVVWKLQIPPRKKIGVLGIFLTGFLACIASTFSMYYRATLRRNSDVTWKLVFVLLWVVVELTVGVMCSCLTTFPGFFRYHLPLLRSIASLFSSSFRSLHFPKLQERSSDPSSGKRLATKDIRITFGARVDGRGLFLDSSSAFAAEQRSLPGPEIAHSSPKIRGEAPLDSESTRTRRDYYEGTAKSQHLPSRYSPSAESRSTQTATWASFPKNVDAQVPAQAVPQSGRFQSSRPEKSRDSWSAWWSRPLHSNHSEKGYWDHLSIFRNGGTNSAMQSKSPAKSATGEV